MLFLGFILAAADFVAFLHFVFASLVSTQFSGVLPS
jgi:hypothetical protein